MCYIIYNYILSQREVQNKRRIRDEIVRKKEQRSFLERTERVKEGNEVIRGYLSKVLALYMKRNQANDIFRVFPEISSHYSEIKINIHNAQFRRSDDDSSIEIG